jgi:D-alanyl-D-alanine carboxypeptidase
MMTLLLTFKFIKHKKILLSSKICISKNAAAQQPCTLGLGIGDTISVRDAIMALITKSANDVAVALGEHLGKDEKSFVTMMNREARRLGMNSTLFLNPSGWKDYRQLTTVKDMAKLARALLVEYPGYYHLFATKQFCFRNQRLKNHNLLLGKNGDIIIDGIKTGFVNASGFNLAASAFKGNNRLIVVVLGGKTGKHRDSAVKLLLQKGFDRLSRGKNKISSKQRNTCSVQRDLTISSGIYNKVYTPNGKTEHFEKHALN